MKQDSLLGPLLTLETCGRATMLPLREASMCTISVRQRPLEDIRKWG